MKSEFLMTNLEYAGVVFMVMLTSGLLGGYASYHLNESVDKSKIKSITLGVVASFIVPVFLNMISSNLLLEAQKQIDKLFIFAGFCILAAVFSRNFLENIYNKVLQQVGNIGKQVKQMEEASSEPEVPIDEVTDEELKKNNLAKNEFELLKKFSTGKFTYRSILGLKKDTGLERSEVDKYLNKLLAKELVQSRFNDKKQLRYFLSEEGRQLLGNMSFK